MKILERGLPLSRVRRDITARFQYYAHVSGILADVRAHRTLGDLFHRPALAPLAAARPELRHKYLWPCLAQRLQRGDRLAIMLAHYRFLAEQVRPTLPAELLLRREELWTHDAGARRFTIAIDYPRPMWDHEGELSLLFAADGEVIYRLLFTFAAASALARRGSLVLLVGAVQGNNGRFDAIRAATRALMDVAPRTILLAAAAGIAQASGIGEMVAVGNERQVTRARTTAERFPFDYDRFWQEMEGVSNDGFFVLSAPLREKPLALVTRSHRCRAQRRRTFREGVTAGVSARMSALLQ